MLKRQEKNSILRGQVGKIKLKSAGISEKEKYPSPLSKPVEQERILYPTIHLSSKEAPDLHGYSTNDQIMLIVEGKIKTHSVNKNSDGLDEENFTFEIHKIGCVDDKC